MSTTVTHNKTTRRPVRYPSGIGAGTRSNRCSRPLDRDALAARLWINGIVKRSPKASMAAAAMPRAMIVAPAQRGGAASRKTLATFFQKESGWITTLFHFAAASSKGKLHESSWSQNPKCHLDPQRSYTSPADTLPRADPRRTHGPRLLDPCFPGLPEGFRPLADDIQTDASVLQDGVGAATCRPCRLLPGRPSKSICPLSRIGPL